MGTLQSQLQMACATQMVAERATQASTSALAVAQAELAALHAIIQLGPDARHPHCQVASAHSDCASAAQHSEEPRQGLLVSLLCGLWGGWVQGQLQGCCGALRWQSGAGWVLLCGQLRLCWWGEQVGHFLAGGQVIGGCESAQHSEEPRQGLLVRLLCGVHMCNIC